MKILLLSIGKTDFEYIKTGAEIYITRLKHYATLENTEIPNVKNAGKLTKEILTQKEAELFEKSIRKEDVVVLLDEKGKQFSSEGFAEFLQKAANRQTGKGRLVFVIGGAFGFHPRMYERADFKLALSSMTFSHQMVRLFFLEQLYRGFTIMKGESYHNS